jgi:hypothetical protein
LRTCYNLMISVALVAILLWLQCTAERWNTSMLQASPPLPENTTVEYLAASKKLEQLDWGCLFNTDKPGHSKNKWHAIDTNKSEALKDPTFLRGTTFWINEYMSVGHMMYDIALLQVLQTTKVDRIILQRAVCISANQCAGIGMFDSFFKGLYTSMIDSYSSEIPLFMRWAWQSRDMKPMYLSSKAVNNEITVPLERRHPSFHLKSATCMERVIRNPMRCTSCFHNSVSPSAAARFKQVAYTLVRPENIWEAELKEPLQHHFSKSGPMVITVAHRGLSASRHIANLPYMVQLLREQLRAPQYDVRVFDTTNMTRGYAEQIRVVAQAQIVIAEHGAFQSNVVYMRNGSLLIDLKGNYTNGENRNFENLARMFGVYYAAVLTENLLDHKAMEFNITTLDCVAIADTVKQYAAEKPYAFNVA